MNKYVLSRMQYRELVNSEYVRKAINPICSSDIRDVARVRANIKNPKMFALVDGVGYWLFDNAPKRVVPMAIAYLAWFDGLNINIEQHQEALDKEGEDFLNEYRKRPRTISDEERFELEAAFGKGETIIDVITGEKIKY